MTDQMKLIEQQMLRWTQRSQTIHLASQDSDITLERSSYNILVYLLDHGPQRLGELATAFALDPSTITRQVQTVVSLDLAEKSVDPTDRRAALLELTQEGHDLIVATRERRLSMLTEIIADWTDDERDTFGHQLRRLNDAVDTRRAQLAE